MAPAHRKDKTKWRMKGLQPMKILAEPFLMVKENSDARRVDRNVPRQCFRQYWLYA